MRLLTGVDQHVRLQVALSDEALAAVLEGADEWPVIGVCPQMCLEITGLAEVLHAVWVRTEKHFVCR